MTRGRSSGWIHGPAAVYQGLSFLSLGAGLAGYELLAARRKRAAANGVGLLAIVLFLVFLTASGRTQSGERRQRQQEQLQRMQNDPALDEGRKLEQMMRQSLEKK